MVNPEITFSVRLPNSGPYSDAHAIREVALLGEELGYEALTVHDHISRSRTQNRHFSAGNVDLVTDDQLPNLYEAMTTLAFAAGLTKRIRLCPTGIILPLRDPRLLAKEASTLHTLSGGRLILGLVIGASPHEFEIIGVPFKERGRRTDEYIEALRRIFDEAPFTEVDGPNVHFENAEFQPKPKGLPIWLCGKGEAAMRRVAHYGQGFLPGDFSPDECREKLNRLDEYLARAGRSRQEIVCGNEIFICARGSVEEAERDAESTMFYRHKKLENARERFLVGSPASICEHIGRYIDAGTHHFELKFVARSLEDQLEMMRRIAEEIVPAFS
jgi:probable F420-dependent oxidoreductase